MNDNRRFKRGSGVYTCHRCTKQTRDTGKGEAQFDLCADCFEIESMENQHSDDGHEGDLSDCQECKDQMTESACTKLENEFRR